MKQLLFALLCLCGLNAFSQAPSYTITGSLPGKIIYIAPTNFFWGDLERYLMVVDGDDGSLLKYENFKGLGCTIPGPFCNNIFGFMPLPSGDFAYIQWDLPSGHVFRIADSAFTPIDTFTVANPDNHEFRVEEGLIYIITRYNTTVDMSGLSFPFGAGSSTQYCEFQKMMVLDSATKAMVFEWDSIDLPFSETDSSYNLDPSLVSPNHMNSVAPIKGIPGWEYVVSCRNRNSVVILDAAGVVYEIGGKGSDFTFVNDTSVLGKFSGQHDANIYTEGGDIVLTLYDNGNKNTPPISRGVKYLLDTLTMEASLVAEYKHPFGIMANSQGSFRAFPEGGGLVNWGGLGPAWFGPQFSAFDSSGSVIMELVMDTIGFASYRAYFVEKEIITSLPVEVSMVPEKVEYYDFMSLSPIRVPKGQTICETFPKGKLYIKVVNGKGRLEQCWE